EGQIWRMTEATTTGCSYTQRDNERPCSSATPDQKGRRPAANLMAHNAAQRTPNHKPNSNAPKRSTDCATTRGAGASKNQSNPPTVPQIRPRSTAQNATQILNFISDFT